MPKPYPLLATREEIKDLAELAFATIAALGVPIGLDEDIDYVEERQRGRIQMRGALEALRFCATAAGLLGNTSLQPLVVRILLEIEKWRDDYNSDKDVALEGLELVLATGVDVTDDIERLARHRDPSVRAAIANGLQPKSPRAIELLEKLARDPHDHVRNPAREALSTTREIPWWAGKFREDPIARLSAEEAAQHKETFEKISALLDAPFVAVTDKLTQLAPLAAPLPDALVVDLCETALTGGLSFAQRAPSLATLMISRKGGADALVRLCKRWCRNDDFLGGVDDAPFLTGAPLEERLSICKALIDFAANEPEKRRCELRSAANLAAELAALAFPPSADLGPLLDTLLAIPSPEKQDIDYVTRSLAAILLRDDVDPSSELDRIVEARSQDYPGAWRRLAYAANRLLQRAPRDVQRKLAEEAIRRDDDDAVRWGLERLLFALHDPERDPEAREMARRFWDEPRYRRLMETSADLHATQMSFLRAALRRDELDFEEAAHVIGDIRRFWGGDPMEMIGSLKRNREELEEDLQAKRTFFAAFLGPEELRGPVTDAEWSALRRARDREDLTKSRVLRLALSTLPQGPIGPEDEHVLEAALIHCEETNRRFALLISDTLTMHPAPDHLPVFERLLARAPEAREELNGDLNDIREELGLPPVRLGGDANEWMDEAEADDDEWSS